MQDKPQPDPAIDGLCRNCGAVTTSRFCPDCGQSTKVAIPSLFSFVQDVLGALFSYDHKLWRTLQTLIKHPGQLTLDYVEGRRVRYLTAFQLFFWLQTVTFVSYHLFFDSREGAGDHISQLLLIIGAFITCLLSLLHIRRRIRFIVHLVAAIHIWAFLMVLLLTEYILFPLVVMVIRRIHLVSGPIYIGAFVTHSTEAIIAIYTTLAIRKVYRDVWWKAALKTLLLFVCYLPFAYLDFNRLGIVHWILQHGLHW